MSDLEQIQKAIAALEGQRLILGDAVVDASLAALRKQLTELEARQALEQRKLVSILFADLVGFTSLSDKLDPEDVRAIQQAYFSAVTAPIKQHGGIIEKYIGDAVMAIFGLPRAEESDPDRAVLAALGMQTALKRLNAHLEADLRIHLGGPLQMRVGVNTGLAIVSMRGSNDFDVVGDSVNLASRLQTSAPVGGVLISQDTYRHVRGAFDLQPLDPITVKGKPEPLQVYLVTAAKRRSFRAHKRGVEGIETRMVGRDLEQQALQDAFSSAVEDHERSALTIIADPGMGKSRLVYEFENWVDLRPERVTVLRGRARMEIQHLPYGLLRDMFAFRFGIQDDDPLPNVWRKMEQGLREDGGIPSSEASSTSDAQMRAHFMGQFLGYDFTDSPYLQAAGEDPSQVQDRGSAYLIDYFNVLAATRPVIFLLEDLHWSDDSSLDFISRLASGLAEKAVLFVATARPALYERRQHWMEGFDFHRRLDLQPLSKRDSRRLVEDVLQKVSNIPEELRELVVTNAEGNPFYVEELIKMLIEGGVIVKGQADWQVIPGRLKQVHIPSTLTGVLQARLDGLPDSERAMLQQASIVGRVFWDRALTYLNKAAAQPADGSLVDATLAHLRQKEMVYRRELSSFAGAQELSFKHAMLREVAYASVLKRMRRQYHRLAAEWLAEVTQASNRIDEYTGLIAEHYLLADEVLTAADWLTRAGDRALLQGATLEAINFFDRALEHLPEAELERRWKALEGRSTVLSIQSRDDEYMAIVRQLEGLAQSMASDQHLAEAQLREASHLSSHSKDHEAIAIFRAAIETARRAGDQALEAKTLALMSISHVRLGQHQAAREAAEAAVSTALQSGQPEKVARVFNNAAVTFIELGDPWKAIGYFEQAIAQYEALGEIRALANSLGNLGYEYILLGTPEQALKPLERSLKIHKDAGARREAAYNALNLGLARIRMGQAGDALVLLQQAGSELGAVGDEFGHACGLSYQALVHEASGQMEEAAACFQQAMEKHKSIGVEAYAVDAQAGLARVSLAAGRLGQAEHHAGLVWDFLKARHAAGMEFPIWAYLTCASVFQALGAIDHGRTAFESGYQELMDRAEKIGDPAWRRSFLENVPEHRQLIRLWETFSPQK
jgi:class 3 adenylate cyclase/tetratricopeptide (TPR) repeat protein